ncbi:hypothetical protein [Kribbella sp. NPDC051770]|uniref:hypothetical protein n=1 Tax=Kribbella sp. NPDC051770 TaxID=3155413 RepID=UPI00341CC037
MVDNDGYTRCEVCELRYEPGEPADEWLAVTVERDGGHATPDFCSQEHAAQWFSESLPSFEPVTIMKPTLRDRLTDIGVALPFGAVAVLAAIGLWTAIGWIWR